MEEIVAGVLALAATAAIYIVIKRKQTATR
ncbi:Uncharacterised protein [uncultured archaeon]|nr:Uncharacterised protein [uncultured archaeon]